MEVDAATIVVDVADLVVVEVSNVIVVVVLIFIVAFFVFLLIVASAVPIAVVTYGTLGQPRVAMDPFTSVQPGGTIASSCSSFS